MTLPGTERNRWNLGAALLVALAVAWAALAPAAHARPAANGDLVYLAAGATDQPTQYGTPLATLDPFSQGAAPLLGTSPNTLGADPAWSPDGARIAFAGCPGAAPAMDCADTGIWTVRADWTGLQRVTPPLGTPVGSPTWSADGARLAFAAGGAVWVQRASGSGTPERVTPEGTAAYAPDWSPDGRTIAYEQHASGAAPTIHVLDLRTSRTRALAPGRSPAWSPDGRTIAYASAPWPSAIWSMSRTGDRHQQLTRPDHEGTSFEVESDSAPAWSPDGRHVAFQRQVHVLPKVAVAAADGTGARELAAGASPDWGPAPRR